MRSRSILILVLSLLVASLVARRASGKCPESDWLMVLEEAPEGGFEWPPDGMLSGDGQQTFLVLENASDTGDEPVQLRMERQ